MTQNRTTETAFSIHHGDCLDVLKTMESDSVDSLVTDPPAGIAFMGKDWDKDKGGRTEWVAWMRDVMTEVHRVLKPGAHGLVWALPRTSHWTAMALEDAGFEIRDSIYWLFGSGFPKSLDVSKAIDKAAGASREVIGHKDYSAPDIRGNSYDQSHVGERERLGVAITAPATDEAKQWQGFGTALKPAVECWWLVRKPLGEKTVAKNVLKHGTGALNIDASRVGSNPGYSYPNGAGGSSFSVGAGIDGTRTKPVESTQGRFPSHLVLSHSIHCTTVLNHDRETNEMSDTQHCVSDCPVRMLDEQSGILKGAGNKSSKLATGKTEKSIFGIGGDGTPSTLYDRGGTASRFFYCAKISTRERNAGLEGMPTKRVGFSDGARRAIERGEDAYETDTGGGANRIKETKNTHPTVKPQKLMRYLIKMITPPGGTVLDPFTGSGSTGCAAVADGFKFIGIERDTEYVAIAEKRIFNSFPKATKQYHLGV